VKGSVVGYDDPANTPNVVGTLSLLGVGFKNEPENFIGGPPDFLESVVNKTGAPLHSGQFQTDETEAITVKPCKPPKNGKPEKCKKSKIAELNTVANPARPEVGRCNKQKGSGKYSDKACTIPAEPGKGKYEFNPAGS